MSRIAKSIACLIIVCTFFSCEKKAATTSTKTSAPAPQEEIQTKIKSLTPFEQEIQKMHSGKEGDEAVLRGFLKGKPKENNGEYVKQGLDYFVSRYGERPRKEAIIDVLICLNRINVEMRNEEALEGIKKQLSEQLKKEQGQ